MENETIYGRAVKGGGWRFWGRSLLLGGVALLAVAAGCDKGGNFEGKWVAAERSSWDHSVFLRRLDIMRNAQNFIIKTSLERYTRSAGILERGGKATWTVTDGEVVSATLREGKLVVNPFASFTYVEKDRTLLGPEGEIYKKESPEVLASLKKHAAEVFQKEYPTASVQ